MKLISPVYQHPSKRLGVSISLLTEETEDSVKPDEDTDHVVSLRTAELPGLTQQRDVAGLQLAESHLVWAGHSQ